MATALKETETRSSPHAGGSKPAPLLAAAAALLALSGAALAVDLPVARLQQQGDLPGDLVRAIHLSEAFAHGTGVGMILLAALTLDPTQRRRLLRVAAGAYGAGLLANAAKLVIARHRPGKFTAGESVFETFHAWLPFLPGRIPEGWQEPVQGFPSAHAATAVGLAVGLAALYPRGRWLFFALAVMASSQRVVAGAHFLSDVLAGAAVGCLTVAMTRDGTPLGRVFDSWERSAAP